ncbi:MAG TPA: hypothetical protein VFB49_09560 [Patescibacteria group bacterium]|nr:hypothetical protein [Patescibacteria group bacterium]
MRESRFTRPARIVLLVAVAALAVQALALDYVVDDAYISMRYARNLVEGHGLVYNAGGERVEGYTNLLWTLLLAAAIACRLDPVLVARLVGIAAGVGVLILADRLARRDGLGSWSVLAPVFLAVNPALVTWSSGGLETTAFTLFVVSGAILLCREGSGTAAGVMLALGCLTRPEGILVAALVGAGAWFASGRAALRRVLAMGLVVGATVLAHETWRLAYYGAWLPNTFYAKTGDLGAQVRAGAQYLGTPLAFFAGGPLLLALIAHGLARRTPISSVAAVMLAGWTLYVGVIGGDGLPMFRFLVPALPFLAILIVSALDRIRRTTPGGANYLAGVGLLMTILPGFLGYQSDYREWDARIFVPKVVRVGKSLRELLGADASIALMPVGAIPYYSGLRTLDMLALNDPIVARKKMRFTTALPGHWKYDAASILARRPDYILLGNVDVTAAPRTAAPLAFAVEQDMARLPQFQRDYRPVSFPLPGGDWLNCYRRADLAPPAGARTPG